MTALLEGIPTTARRTKQQLAVTLKKQMDERNVTISDLARQLDTGRTSIRRLLDPENTSITLQTIAKAAGALGLEITLHARQLTGRELTTLARRMVNAPTKEEADMLEDQIVAGFYGKPINATHSKPENPACKKPIPRRGRDAIATPPQIEKVQQTAQLLH